MSLMKKRILTERQKAAARANGRRSHGAATAEGRGNIRESNLQHGLYSESKEIVLTGIGEKWEDFEDLRRGIRESWPIAQDTHPDLVESLALAMWRLHRFERRQVEIEMQQALETRNHQRWTIGEATVLESMSAERCAQREVIRISRLLMEAEAGSP